MNVTYKKKFLKDLKDLQSTEVYKKICNLVLEEIPNADDLSTLANLSKLKGDDTAYRIRVGDYRIGFFRKITRLPLGTAFTKANARRTPTRRSIEHLSLFS